MIDYTRYLGYTINNCKWIELSKVIGRHRTILVQCILCGKEINKRGYGMLYNGLGCCTNQIYDTLEPKRLFKFLHQSHLKTAKQRGYPSEISFEDYAALRMKSCEYPRCINLPYITKRDDLFYTVKVNGIDRIDNTKNYSYGNLGTLCWLHNKIKNETSMENLINWSGYFNIQRK